MPLHVSRSGCCCCCCCCCAFLLFDHAFDDDDDMCVCVCVCVCVCGRLERSLTSLTRESRLESFVSRGEENR